MEKFNINIYEKIKMLCQGKGITANKLAKIIGLTQSTISSWNEKAPNVVSLAKVADYFDVSLDYFMEREKDYNNFFLKNSNNSNSFNTNNGNTIINNNESNSLMDATTKLMQDFSIDETLELLQHIKSIREKRG